MHSALKIPVAAQHRRHYEVILFYGASHFLRQGTAVADAGRTAVADYVEAELLKVGQQVRCCQILSDYALTREPDWS